MERRKAFLLSSQLYGNQRICQRGLNGDRLFRGEFARRVTEMMTSDPEEFFRYFRMDRTVFDEILTSIHLLFIKRHTETPSHRKNGWPSH